MGPYSTVADDLKFVRMMLNADRGDGDQALKPETVALMSRNAMGYLRVAMLRGALPLRARDAEFSPGMPEGWGLTFMIDDEEASTGRSAGSLARAGLANTCCRIDQRQGVGGVFATQVLPFADERALALNSVFEAAVYASPG